MLVGILDTGVDGSHPDIAPNFDKGLSRNFTVDVPAVDGPCADEPDASCNDPNDVDENSHGTHVASTVGSPINGLGMAGVAPNVTLVNIRAGQDSGFFFLQPSVDALTYAGDNGIDVANMSYFIDPWLYNCGNPLHPVPEDSVADKAAQATIIEATQRALDYAHQRGVTLIAAAGNGHDGHHHPEARRTEPELPARHQPQPHGQQHVPGPADGGQQRHQRLVGRPEQDEGRLLQLGLRRDRRCGSGRLVPRRGLAGDDPGRSEPDPRRVPEERGRRGR